MKAKFKNECFICYCTIYPGDLIRRSRSNKFVHEPCGKAAEAKAAITAGLTFAGHKASEWRVGRSPSSQNRKLG